MRSVEDFFASMDKRHAVEVAAGKHDAACEHAHFYICNCSKRRREAAGFTTPPNQDLDFPPPSCPRCERDLSDDDDGWVCDRCSLAWDSHGSASSVRFTDDMGDLSPCAAHNIRGHVMCAQTGGSR